MNYSALLKAFMPEAILVFGALLVLTHDLLGGRGRSHEYRAKIAAALGVVAVCIAGWMATTEFTLGATVDFLANDKLAFGARLAILTLSGLTVLFIGGTSKVKNPAEHVALMLFASSGFTLMAAAQNLLVAFLAFELSSLSLYILAGFDKTRRDSAEAGLKYFLFGGMAAAFMLFGFSLIYGLTGEISLAGIAAKLPQIPLSPLLIVAFVMIFVGFGYKAAAAPFHLWAPDAYQGAPATSAALIASASKVAGFVLLARFLAALLTKAGSIEIIGASKGWLGIFGALVIVSLLLGNIGALAQSNVRRLLAYSAIGHAGVMLLAALVTGVGLELPEVRNNLLLYYVFTYGIASVGAFGVIAVVENNGGCQQLSDLASLSKRSPLLGISLMVSILSLAGIPPLAGFYAKFSVFETLLRRSSIASAQSLDNVIFWLVMLAIAMSAIALYYYLQILKQALVVSPDKDQPTTPIRVPFMAAVSLLLCMITLIAVGVYPDLLMNLLK
ncbi:MAG: NADH-quinone oxidoreductase subunit N [Puniceicoccales bacterium]|jgi:NADH-quinone oxidoreductase subunit N|nr:NADH-quinone oxidoreductase subunit N [Puniceicoccales bacterium]